jgi:hypothetical protein
LQASSVAARCAMLPADMATVMAMFTSSRRRRHLVTKLGHLLEEL